MFLRYGAPCGFSGRFGDGSFSMKTKLKIRSNLHSIMKMRGTHLSGSLKSEDYELSYVSKMTTAF